MESYIKKVLIASGFLLSLNKGITSEIYFDQNDAIYQRVKNQPLQISRAGLGNAVGFDTKTYIEDPRYKGISALYDNYPKIPRVQGYGHQQQHTYIAVEFPRDLMNIFLNNKLNVLFKDIPKENINIFYLAQNCWEDNFLLASHYYVDPNCTNDPNTNSTKNISAMIFNIDDQNFTFEGQQKDTFLNGPAITHWGHDAIVASPNNFNINGYRNELGAFFCSIVTCHEEDPNQSKGALTFHYLPPSSFNDFISYEFNNTVTNINNIEDFYESDLLPDFTVLNDKLNSVIDSIQSRRKEFLIDQKDLPNNFNVHRYLEIHPNLRIEANRFGIDEATYAQWHYVNHDPKNGTEYLPTNFNPGYYNFLYPGVAQEAQSLGRDPLEYAQWHYINYGHNHSFNHTHPDFNPGYYNFLYPGVEEEAQRLGRDPLEYAQWHYINHGYLYGFHYIHPNFNPGYYNFLYPGVEEEAQRLSRDPLEYAQWHYTNYGYNHGFNYINSDFNPGQYNLLYPGVAQEAQSLGKDLLQYAEWHYTNYGYNHGFIYPKL